MRPHHRRRDKPWIVAGHRDHLGSRHRDDYLKKTEPFFGAQHFRRPARIHGGQTESRGHVSIARPFRLQPRRDMSPSSSVLALDIQDYVLSDVLGVGTVGTIYAATHKETGAAVAIKRLHPGVSREPTIVARFKREMLILGRLRHPNIIEYHGGGTFEDQLFYVMELVDGGTVKELLATQGPMAWPVVVELTRQICSALQCAHNHGVIHRDLKPGNLFLTMDGELKLGDFGIARDQTRGDLTSAGMTVGTHAYMAPEQITGDQSISGKADLYALGCCIFEMLTGRKVFDGENFAQLFEQHLRTPPPRVGEFVPDCPEQLDEVCFQLLAKDPEQRPFNARAVQGTMIQLEDLRAEQLRQEGSVSTATEISPGGESGVAGDLPSQLDHEHDVAADSVEFDGRALLRQKLLIQMDPASRPEISWGRLLAIIVVLTIIIGLASLWGRHAG